MNPAERLPPARPASSVPQEPYPHRVEELEADAEPPFATLPDIGERDLQADTLAFERLGRRHPRNWAWLKLVLVLAVVGGAGAGAWRMWGQDLLRPAGDEIPTVRAIDGPFKVRPDAPGGADIPNRGKLVYERLEPGKGTADRPAESLRPRPEAPLPPPTAARTTAPDAGAAASAEGSPQMVEGPGSEEDEEENTQATIPVAPAPLTPPTAPTAAVPASPSAAIPSSQQVRAAERPAPPPAPPLVKAEDTAAVATAIPPRAFKIQLGAVRSEAAARIEWDKLRKTYGPVLGRLALNVERADLGTKGVYFRIQAGPFSDRAAADAACVELAKQKVPCLPIRPES